MIVVALFTQSTNLVTLSRGHIEILHQKYRQTGILLDIMSLLSPTDPHMTGMDAVLVILRDPHVTGLDIMIIEIILQFAVKDPPMFVIGLLIAERNPHMVVKNLHMIGIGIGAVTMITKPEVPLMVSGPHTIEFGIMIAGIGLQV